MFDSLGKEPQRIMDHPLIDWGTISVIIGAIIGWLPHLAVILPIIWWSIKIYETKTVQKVLAWALRRSV